MYKCRNIYKIISVQLHVGGDNVAVGYFKNPKETEECFYEADGRR
jgi:hypothetical protein